MAAGTIIGRRDELDVVDAFVAADPAAVAALVLEGAAGVGKTTLWQAGLGSAAGRGYEILSARPVEAEARLAFAGLADLLGAVADLVLPSLPAIQRRALESVLLVGSAPPGAEERVVGAAALSALRRLGAERSVLLAIDDLQWLDSPSTRALSFAFRRLDADAVRLLATVRVEPVGTGSLELIEALPRDRTHSLWVGPLTVGGIYELVRDHLGMSLPRPALLRLHELSDGNPFFALELAKSLPPDRLAASEMLELPRSLADVIRTRIAALPNDVAEVLVAASALADPDVDVIERALPQAEVTAAIAEAEHRRIAELAGGRVRFSHPLLASSVYAAASPRERRRIHRSLAEAVASAEERARHLAIAADGPDAAVAAALEDAAAETATRGAVTAAAELAAMAVELTPPDLHEALHRRRLLAARSAFAAGDTKRAQTLAEAGLVAAAPGLERGELLHELAKIAFTQDMWAALDLARRAADEAVDAPSQRAMILVGLAKVVNYRGEGYEAALPYAREAVELAEQADDPHVLAEALTMLGYVEHGLGCGIDHAAFERAEALVGGIERSHAAATATYRYCATLVSAREYTKARARLERLVELGRERGDSGLCAALSCLADVELDEGNWERAWRLAVELESIAEQFGWEAFVPAVHSLQALIEALKGNVAAARRRALDSLEQTEAYGRMSGGPLRTLSLLELSVERYEEALGHLLEYLLRLREHSYRDPVDTTSDAVEALAALGRIEEADHLLDEFEESARRLDRRWALAAAARCRGFVAAARGELDKAECALEESVERWEEVGFPFELGRSLLALGTIRRRLRRKRAARDALERATELFDRLGAAVWAERARTETARIGGRTAAREGLSGTEDAIARLAASGKPNREIAEALHLSRHTVEWNLSRIYRKLGVHSRTELAARSGRE